MNNKEQKQWIKGLINNVLRDILEESEKYPSNWDGIELRERIKDAFDSVVIKGVLTGKRKRDYKNFILVNGLI